MSEDLNQEDARREILKAVDLSIVETMEAFVRFRSGFHGDTGIRDFLYHRLMTNLQDDGTFTSANGMGTLRAQAEWYTELKYRRTGENSSCGRFDIGIPDPEELEHPKPHALVAFECGRNKTASNLLRDCEALEDHDGPESADITKLTREILYGRLRYGYALEFYDGPSREAMAVIDSVTQRIPKTRCRIIVLTCIGGSPPEIALLPKAWEIELRSKFAAELEQIQALKCSRRSPKGYQSPTVSPGRFGNRVSKGNFLSSCSAEAGALIQAVEKRFGAQLKLIFGGNTMTINRQPSGKLLRIDKLGRMSELDPVIRQTFSARRVPIQNSSMIEATEIFQDSVLDGLQECIR